MKNTKNIYLHSLVVIPFLAAAVGMSGGVPVSDPSTLILDITNKVSTVAPKELTEEEKSRAIDAAKIDAYYAENKMPLEGYGMKIVLEADKHNIDRFLLVGISVAEHQGGITSCHNPKGINNLWGWGGCQIGFESVDVAIEKISENLGGHNENTDQWYAGKTTVQKLAQYNRVNKSYTKKVLKVMDDVSKIDVSIPRTIALKS